MKTTDLNAHQIEAIANADAHTSNAGLPTYSELLNALNGLALSALSHEQLAQHDHLRTQAYEAQTLVCKAL